MRVKNNLFIAGAIFIIVSAFYPYAAAQTDVSFDIPAPGNSNLLETKELDVVGLPIYLTIYESAEALSAVVYYYRNFFSREGFQKISDTADEKRKKCTLRFKKDQLIVDVMVMDRQAKREISVSKFLQPAEETSAQAAGRLLAKNLIPGLPQEDLPGVDLVNVPRPPQSVRIMSQDCCPSATITYCTSLDVAAAADFYRGQMPLQQWELVDEIALQKALEAYKQISGKSTLGIKSPFPDGENFQQVISDSQVLEFRSGSDTCRITIFPNFLSRDLGSMVQIAYQEKEQ